MKKLKLVYDASIIRFGAVKNGGRTGVYVTALNILRELAKRSDVELTIYCHPFAFYDVEDVLGAKIPELRSQILKESSFCALYGKIRAMKRKAKDDHFLKKLFINFFSCTCAIIFKMALPLYRKNTFSNYDAFFSPLYLIPKYIKTRRFILLHDLIPMLFPEYASHPWGKGHYLYDLCQTINGEDHYFANSECTRRDFLNNFPVIDSKNIVVTPLACSENFRPGTSLSDLEKVKNKYNIPADKKYIFSLCTLEPRKNLIRIAKTFIEFIEKHKIDDLVLVLGGGHWTIFIDKLKNTIHDIGDGKIIRAGYVDDEDLPILYGGAEWFVYSSAYEGFGLPPLEAMNCGCPVIVSNNSSLPEIVGDAGILVNWKSDEQHIAAFEKYYFDKDFREKMREKAMPRTQLFSWEKCTDQIVQNIKATISTLGE